MIWFTSDTHFGHANVIKHDNRPFSTVDEMDQAIIDNWNTYVTPQDRVYHLGDWSFRSKHSEWYNDVLKGQIHIVWGNHDDREAYKFKHRFASHQDIIYTSINGQKIHMLHYKMQVWRSSHHGSWHLFGHSHGNLKNVTGKCLDVGITNKGWKPGIPWLYSYDEIAAYMNAQPLTDHHPSLV